MSANQAVMRRGGDNAVREDPNAGQAVEPQADPQPPQPQGSRFWSVAQGLIFRALIIYFITSFFRKSSTPATGGAGSGGLANTKPAISSSNLFTNGTVMDLFLYICDDELKPDFDDKQQLVWHESGLVYGDWTSGPTGDGIYTKDVSVGLSPSVQNNGTLWLHIYVTKAGRGGRTAYPS
ncbi:unnamed protein product, partial [Oppiella nova]